MKGKILLMVLALAAAGCTKDKQRTHTEDGKPLVSNKVGDPETLILSLEIDVPKQHAAKIKKSDLLLWDLKDDKGNVLAMYWFPVPKFPFQLDVRAKHLNAPIVKDGNLMLSARIVKFGDEIKPPKKGQLQLFVGAPAAKPDEKIVKPAVNPELLEKFYKQNPSFRPAEALAVGSKVKAELSPAVL